MTSIPHLSRLAAALLVELSTRSAVADGAPFRAGHRALALVLGCSAGSLPRLMLELERAGCIVRTPDRNRFLISVIEPLDQVAADAPAVIDQSCARSQLIDRRATTDRSIDAPRHRPHQNATERTTTTTPPAAPPYKRRFMHAESMIGSSSSPPAQPAETEQRADLVAELRADGAATSVVERVLAARPELDVTTYQQERAWCEQRERGVGYLFAALMRGSTLRPRGGAPADHLIDVAALPLGDLYRSGSDVSGLDPALLKYLEVCHAAA